jgi:hypothetical protein
LNLGLKANIEQWSPEKLAEAVNALREEAPTLAPQKSIDFPNGEFNHAWDSVANAIRTHLRSLAYNYMFMAVNGMKPEDQNSAS